jgi:hypothetical protein
MRRCVLPCVLIWALLAAGHPGYAGLLQQIGKTIGKVVTPPPEKPQQAQAADKDPAQELIRQAGGEYMDDAAMVARFVGMVDRLRPCMIRGDVAIQPHLINNATVNAAATASGILLMYRGMMEATEGKDGMLAAVVGHELGHIDRQHGVRQGIIDIIVGELGARYGGLSLVGGLVVANRSQKDEFEADKCGLIYMLQAGYDADGALELQRKLVEMGGSGTGVDAYFSTHPPGPQRIEHLRAQLPGILLGWGDKAKATRRPGAAVACDAALVGRLPSAKPGETPRPCQCATDVAIKLAKSGQMEPVALAPNPADLKAALTSAAVAGQELLVWCYLAVPQGGKRASEPRASVYDVASGLLLTNRKAAGRDARSLALAVLSNRNWRHGGR